MYVGPRADSQALPLPFSRKPVLLVRACPSGCPSGSAGWPASCQNPPVFSVANSPSHAGVTATEQHVKPTCGVGLTPACRMHLTCRACSSPGSISENWCYQGQRAQASLSLNSAIYKCRPGEPRPRSILKRGPEGSVCLHEHLAYNIRRDGNNWVITIGPTSFVFKKKKSVLSCF